jgi:shikimate dehydrogenase
MTKRLGVIGYPLSHTLSPVFQQAALDYHSVPATYSAWPTPPELLDETVQRLRGDDYLGFNITIPHKVRIIELVDDVEDMAKKIGAVNTVVKRGGSLVGYNTDAFGFVKSLKEKAKFDPRGKTVLLLGAGGAARAAAYGLANEGVAKLTIANRTVARAESLANEVAGLIKQVEPVPLDGVAVEADLIVNSTSIGMAHAEDHGRSPLATASLPSGILVYDMVYTPAETPLMRQATEAGALGIGGLWMLVYQGAAAFELWTAKPAPVSVMYRAAEIALS